MMMFLSPIYFMGHIRESGIAVFPFWLYRQHVTKFRQCVVLNETGELWSRKEKKEIRSTTKIELRFAVWDRGRV